MEQIRVIKEMREKDAESGRTGADIRPRFMVWENVVHVLSINEGRDFAAVLEETIRVVQPEIPDIHVPVGGWTLSGSYVGDGFSVAWRVLDAQFWGVPQRRRRIALVADFGGQSAPEILFKQSSSFRYLKPCKEERERTAGDAADCAGESSGSEGAGVTEPVVLESNQNHATITDSGVSPTLSASMGMGGGYVPMIADTVAIEGNGTRESHKGDGYVESDKMYTLNTVEQHSVCYGISAYESNAMLSDNPHSGVYEAETARTLDLNGGNPACNQGGIAIVERSAGFCPNMGAKAEGIGYAEEQAPTIRTNCDAAVVYPDIARTLTARNDGSPCVDRGPDVICLEMTSTKNTVSDDGVCPTLTARMGTGGNQVNTVVQESPEVDTFAMQGFGDYIKSDVGSSCRARDYKDATDLICSHTGERQNATTPAKQNTRYIVRRLTPLECTRLQGLPDGWLDIGDWYDDNGRLHKESDSVKYKALGNSIAIPPWLFVLGSLNEYCEDKTMASLFDGISGFPLIWSFLNGKDNCVWSSEVDSFCRAVARIRFPDTSDDTKTSSKN